MGSFYLQIQRFVLLAISVAGIMVLASGWESGWLPTHIEHIIDFTQFDFYKKLVNRSLTDAVPYIVWQHYLLLVTCIASLALVVLSLLKPNPPKVLLMFDWGITLAVLAAGLFFFVFGTQVLVGQPMQLLVMAAVIICSTLAFERFVSAFTVFPTVITAEQIIEYRNRYMRPARATRDLKNKWWFQWRRNMLAWQFRIGRRYLSFKFRLSRKRPFITKVDRVNFLCTRILPLVLVVSLSVYWGLYIYLPEFRTPGLDLILAPGFLALILGWGISGDKILLNYRLGDAGIKKQVLWLIIGLFLPSILGLEFHLALLLVFVHPEFVDPLFFNFFLILPIFAFLSFVVCLMISVFFYGAIDPERTLRISALYSLLGLVLAVIFALAEHTIGPMISELFGLKGEVVSAAITASAIHPLRHRIEHGVEKLISTILDSKLPD